MSDESGSQQSLDALRQKIDALDRELVRLLSRRCEAGRHGVDWDGRDAAGRRLPSGSYLVRLRTESEVRGSKLTLVR